MRPNAKTYLCMLLALTSTWACTSQSKSTAAYRLGGMATGLVAPITLQLTGGERLELAADGPFFFNTRLARGTPYFVVVVQAPPQLICTVARPGGVMGADDSTTLAVSCSAATPGSQLVVDVSGLRGTVTLVSELGDTLAVSADGRYPMTARHASQSIWRLDVAAQPDAQRCVAAPATGRVGDSETVVRLTCVDVFPLSLQVSGVKDGHVTFSAGGADTLTFVADGNAAFATAYAVGETYTVTLTDQSENITCDNQAFTGTQDGNTVLQVHCVTHFRLVVTVIGVGAGGVTAQNDAQQTQQFAFDASGSFSTWYAANQPYSVTFTANDSNRACVPQTVSGIFGQSTQAVATRCGVTAERVLGQVDASSQSENRGAAVAADTLSGPIAVAATQQVLVADSNNHRIAAWQADATPGSDASFVVGQADSQHADATAAAPDTTDPGLDGPCAVAVQGNTVALGDCGNRRVLLFDSMPQGLARADLALQPATGPGCNAFALSSGGLALGGGRLAVVDAANRRVLLYDTVPTDPNATPQHVLGGGDGNACDLADTTLAQAAGVWTDGNRIVVADTGHNRVLLWQSWPSASNIAADVVLGQADLNGSAPGTTASTLRGPIGVTSNGNRLWVADAGNNRIVVYNSWPHAHGPAADAVLGQPNAAIGAGACPLAAAIFTCSPSGVAAGSDGVWVADTGYNRVLFFAD